MYVCKYVYQLAILEVQFVQSQVSMYCICVYTYGYVCMYVCMYVQLPVLEVQLGHPAVTQF